MEAFSSTSSKDDQKDTLIEVVVDPVLDRIRTCESKLSLFYEIDAIGAMLTASRYHRIALQFPDSLLPDAPFVMTWLQKRIPESKLLFILGDTSYGSCCVDEVAAQHLAADLVIHFGPACRSATTFLPVYYVFGRYPIETDDCVDKIATHIDQEQPPCTIILLHDPRYLHAMVQIQTQLGQRLSGRVLLGSMAREYSPNSENEAEAGLKLGNQMIPNDAQLDPSTIVVYIGSPSAQQFINILLRCNENKCLLYNPLENVCTTAKDLNRTLMRRYYLVQKAKEAEIVGILVGTLGVKHYMETVNALRQQINASGRKSYLFVVGKINVPKLANFAEIDVFVIVACPENTMIDCKEFYKPIVTPYELNLALNNDREWTGEYRLDFQDILPTLLEPMTQEPEPYFSLITGTLTSSSKASPVQLAYEDNGCSELTKYTSAAGDFLQQRQYQGLDARIGQDTPHEAQPGAFGIARGYSINN